MNQAIQATGNGSFAAWKKRCETAQSSNAQHAALVDEVYRYVLPMRRPANASGASPANMTGSTQTPGARLQDAIFDGTAPRAAWRFAGRIQRDFTPPGQQFFNLKTGPLIPEGDARKRNDEDLQTIGKIVSAQINGSNFSVASHEAYFDLFGGDLALLMHKTGNKSNPVHYIAVPSTEVAVRRDRIGLTAGIYWTTMYLLGDIEQIWPDAQISEKLRKKIDANPNEEIAVTQACERADGAWLVRCWTNDCKDFMVQRREKRCPWICFSFWQVPGEDKGRGPGMVALGPVKVANKVQELALKNAAFAALGLWMYRDDGVFRVGNTPMAPGAFLKVQSTGGPFGPSISKLEMGKDFDVSLFVLEQLQTQIKQATLDDTLPPETGAVRSATEIVERMKRFAADWSGPYARMQWLFLKPLIEFNIQVAADNNVLPDEIDIDEILISLQVTSPAARGDQAASVEAEVKWVELLSLFGPQAVTLLARVEDMGAEWGRKLGVEERFIRSNTDKKKMQEALVQVMAAQMQGQAGAAPQEVAA